MKSDFKISEISKYVKKKYWFLPKAMIEGITGAILLHLLMW